MTLHNHLLTNTIPLPPHHHIHFLNSQKNVSQNRTHFPQNLSHANPSLPTEHHPTNSPGPEKNLSQNRTHFPQNLSHAAWSTHIVVLHTQQEVWIILSKVKRAPVFFSNQASYRGKLNRRRIGRPPSISVDGMYRPSPLIPRYARRRGSFRPRQDGDHVVYLAGAA